MLLALQLWKRKNNFLDGPLFWDSGFFCDWVGWFWGDAGGLRNALAVCEKRGRFTKCVTVYERRGRFTKGVGGLRKALAVYEIKKSYVNYLKKGV